MFTFNEMNCHDLIESLSAIGTFIIGCITLWLTIKDGMLRIKANFSNSILSSPTRPNILDNFVYSINITNIGRREAIISQGILWHTNLFSGKKNIVDVTYMYNEYKKYNPDSVEKFRLKDGNSLVIFYPKDIFATMEVGGELNKFIFRKNKFITYFCIFTFKVYINTSINKKIKIKTSFKFRNNLRKEYLSKWYNKL